MKKIAILILAIGIVFLVLGIININKLITTKIDETKDSGDEKLYKYTKRKDYIKRSIAFMGYGIIMSFLGMVLLYLFKI